MLSRLSAKAADEIGGEKRGVGRRGDDEPTARAIGLCPRDPGMDARERAGMAGDAVRHHGEAEGREARQIAIGDNDEVRDLRPEALHDVGEDGASRERQQRFVGPAHAARFAAGKENADTGRGTHSGTLGRAAMPCHGQQIRMSRG